MTKRKDARIDDQALEGICVEFLRTALGGPDTDVGEARLRNLIAYNATPEGDFAPPEVLDRSDFVATDVADTIEGMLPQIMRMFVASDDAVECEAKKQGGEDMAKSATAYLNHLFYVRNDGLSVLYDWFKDALVQKVGFVQVWAEEEFEDTRATYEGLTEEQVASLFYDKDVEIIGEPQVDEMGGITVTVGHTGKKIAIKVAAIAPHEMRIDNNARWGDDPAAIGRVYACRKFELDEEGFDTSRLTESTARGYLESLEMLGETDDSSGQEIHESHRLVERSDLYLKLDRDGDGVAEWLKVCMIGDKIGIKDGQPAIEQVDDHPFAEICPIPRPHAYFGDCPADRAYQPQKQRTNLVRALFDTVYLTAAPRTYVNTHAGVNIDDLLESRPGGVVRGTSPPNEAFAPMVTPNMAGPAWQLNEWVESWRESRTLFNRYSAGTDANALNKTKGGVEILTQKADMGMELIARFFAQGVRKMFGKLLKLAVKHQDQQDWINVNGKFVAVMPGEWKDQFNLRINVGLGQGTNEQRAARIMAMVPLQQMGQMAGVVQPKHIANTIRLFATSQEFKNPDEFADAEPSGLPQPEQFQQMQQQMQQIGQENEQLKQQAASKDGELQIKAAELELKQAELQLKSQESQASLELQAQAAQRADIETSFKTQQPEPMDTGHDELAEQVAAQSEAIAGIGQAVQQMGAMLQALLMSRGGQKEIVLNRGPDDSIAGGSVVES